MSELSRPTILLLFSFIYLIFTLHAFSQEESQYPKVSEKLMQAEITTIDGNLFKLADLKGKVILVNLWATWCGPCLTQIPYLVELQKNNSYRTFEVLGISIGDGGNKPEETRLIKLVGGRMTVNFTLGILSNEAISEFYSITKQTVVPQALLIDRNGHLRAIFVGGGTRLNESMKRNTEKVINEN